MGYTSIRLDSFARRVKSSLYTIDACNTPQAERLFSMHCLPEALPHSRTDSRSIYIGYYTHLLDGRIVEGPLVG
jgi:hypothetical protein